MSYFYFDVEDAYDKLLWMVSSLKTLVSVSSLTLYWEVHETMKNWHAVYCPPVTFLHSGKCGWIINWPHKPLTDDNCSCDACLIQPSGRQMQQLLCVQNKPVYILRLLFSTHPSCKSSSFLVQLGSWFPLNINYFENFRPFINEVFIFEEDNRTNKWQHKYNKM
jgi:hypothetical protein